MKLRKQETGEIKELPDGFFCGDTLKQICEEWENYVEPKEHYLINSSLIGVLDAEEQIFNNMKIVFGGEE